MLQKIFLTIYRGVFGNNYQIQNKIIIKKILLINYYEKNYFSLK